MRYCYPVRPFQKSLLRQGSKNTILEIECDKVVTALEILEREDFVDETSIFGNQIHVIVNDLYKNEDQVRNVLKRNSITIIRIDKIVPTLEDVFIHLLEKKYNKTA